MPVSRPLLGVLLATVVGFVVWTVALKPSSSETGGGPSGVGSYQTAIDKAHQAVATSGAASVAHGGTVVTAPTAHPATATTATHAATATTATHPATATTAAHSTAPKTGAHPAIKSPTHAATKTAAHAATKPAVQTNRTTVAKPSPTRTAAERQNVVESALASNKVVALLFFNPAAADDEAVKAELAAVPTHGGRVVKLAVPLSELIRYPVITTQVPITGTPTLVLIDGAHHASTLVGFDDRFEIAGRVADALAVKG